MSAHKVSVREIESWITEEHLQIRALLDGLKAVGDPYVLLPILRELRGKLERHFDREEGDEGLHTFVQEFAPEKTDLVDQLLREHRELLSRVNELIGQCNECIAGPLTQIKWGIKELVDQLQTHDVAESEILTDSLLKELEAKGR